MHVSGVSVSYSRKWPSRDQDPDVTKRHQNITTGSKKSTEMIIGQNKAFTPRQKDDEGPLVGRDMPPPHHDSPKMDTTRKERDTQQQSRTIRCSRDYTECARLHKMHSKSEAGEPVKD